MCFSTDTTIEAPLEGAFPVSDQGFIGETEARLRVSSRWEIAVVLGSRQPRKIRIEDEELTCD
jgi:hypothetical protein